MLINTYTIHTTLLHTDTCNFVPSNHCHTQLPRTYTPSLRCYLSLPPTCALVSVPVDIAGIALSPIVPLPAI